MSALPGSVARLDPGASWWERRACWLWESILEGRLDDHAPEGTTAYPVLVETVGRLPLADGRFVAGDPYVMGSDRAPFNQALPSSTPDVLAIRAQVGPDHKRVAALALQCGSAPVASWTMATIGGQDVATLGVEGFFGYGVDAGAGAFGAVDAMEVATRVLATDEGMLQDPISVALFADGIGTESAVCVEPEEGATPIAVCSSGWGDGAYPTWLGHSADGEIVLAITDFLLTGDPFAEPPPTVQPRPVPTDPLAETTAP